LNKDANKKNPQKQLKKTPLKRTPFKARFELGGWGTSKTKKKLWRKEKKTQSPLRGGGLTTRRVDGKGNFVKPFPEAKITAWKKNSLPGGDPSYPRSVLKGLSKRPQPAKCHTELVKIQVSLGNKEMVGSGKDSVTLKTLNGCEKRNQFLGKGGLKNGGKGGTGSNWGGKSKLRKGATIQRDPQAKEETKTQGRRNVFSGKEGLIIHGWEKQRKEKDRCQGGRKGRGALLL